MNPSIDQKRQWELMNGANRLIVELFKRPTWTIAMGAMLASGLRPVPGCKKVPDEAVWLLDASQPANARQLLQARQVVDEWTEDRQDEDAWGVPGEECSPLEFLKWCDATYQDSPRSMKPEWLDYFVSLTEVPSPSAPQSGSSIEMTERLLLLEHFALVKAQFGADNASPPRKVSAGSYGAKMAEWVDNGEFTVAYAMACATAQDSAMQPFDVVEILAALAKMAGEERWQHAVRIKQPPSPDSVVLQYPKGKGWRTLSREVLLQHFGRIKSKQLQP